MKSFNSDEHLAKSYAMPVFNPMTFEFEENQFNMLISNSLGYDSIKNSVLSKSEYEVLDIVCEKCNSKMPTQRQLKSHQSTCTGRASFMRLSNSHPEYHFEAEVFWILKKYIDEQIKLGKCSADMPIGSKYLPYAESLEATLKIRFNQIEFSILYRTETQIVIRCSW